MLISNRVLYLLIVNMFFVFVKKRSDNNRHQRTDQIEDTIRQIGEGRNAEDCCLGHTARIPGNQYRADGRRILNRATQESRLISSLAVEVTEEISREDNRDILIGGAEVKENTRTDGRCHSRRCTMHQAQEDIGHRGQHSAAGHHATKAHCADNEPYRCEHSRHSARSNQVVQLGTARLDRCRSVAAGQHTLKSREKVERLDTGNLGENFGLRNHQRHARHNARGEEGDNGGQFASDKHTRKQRHEQQPGCDIEGLLEARRHSHGVARIGVIHDHSCHRKDYECHHKRRNRRTHHIADMRENRHLNGRRCEHRRIGQNRDLITEICTRDD